MNPILYCHLLIFRIRLSAGFELEPAHPPHYLTEFPSRFLQASQLIVELGLQAGQPGPFKTATAAPACRSDSITGATATAGGLAFAAGPSIVADN